MVECDIIGTQLRKTAMELPSTDKFENIVVDYYHLRATDVMGLIIIYLFLDKLLKFINELNRYLGNLTYMLLYSM